MPFPCKYDQLVHCYVSWLFNWLSPHFSAGMLLSNTMYSDWHVEVTIVSFPKEDLGTRNVTSFGASPCFWWCYGKRDSFCLELTQVPKQRNNTWQNKRYQLYFFHDRKFSTSKQWKIPYNPSVMKLYFDATHLTSQEHWKRSRDYETWNLRFGNMFVM